jgi:hypothetical protein
MTMAFAPDEEQQINSYWGLGDSGGGVPIGPPQAPPAMTEGWGPLAPSPETPPAPPASVNQPQLGPVMSSAPSLLPDDAKINGYWASGGDSGGGVPAAGALSAGDASVPAYWGGGSGGGVPMSGGGPSPAPAPASFPGSPPISPSPLNPATIDPFRQGASLSMGPRVPTGPSAADDAAFADYMARTSKPKTPTGRGSGSSSSTPDPFGIDAARRGQLAAYDDQIAAMRRAADAAAVGAVNEADARANFSRMQQEDAAIASAEAELSQRHFDDGMQEIGRQLDDVRAKKVDPFRLMKEHPALAVLAVIGGGISGMYQARTHGAQNEFLADLDRQLDRAMAEDERQIRDQKDAIGQASNLLAQQRAVQKDTDLAKLQTRNLQYEAVKQDIAARAAADDIPAARARADQMIAQVEDAQAKLAEVIGEKKRAQAAAVAGQSFAAQKEVLAMRNSVYEKVLQATGSPEIAEQEADRQITRMYAPGTVGRRPVQSGGMYDGLTREQAGKLRMEHSEADRATQEFNAQIDALRDHPAITESGLVSSALSGLPQRMTPTSNKYEQDLNEINTRILQDIGKVAKDADGKPNKAMLDKLEQRFEIHQGDSTEMKLQKLEGARNIYNSLARQQGAMNAPMPGDSDRTPQSRGIAKKVGATPYRGGR